MVKALAVDLGGSHAACAVVADREVAAVETVSLEAAQGLAGALPAIEALVRRHAWTPWGQVAVRLAALGERAALLGAVPLLRGE